VQLPQVEVSLVSAEQTFSEQCHKVETPTLQDLQAEPYPKYFRELIPVVGAVHRHGTAPSLIFTYHYYRMGEHIDTYSKASHGIK
jgi:hypothetical protein